MDRESLAFQLCRENLRIGWPAFRQNLIQNPPYCQCRRLETMAEEDLARYGRGLATFLIASRVDLG